MRTFLALCCVFLTAVSSWASCPPGYHWWPGGHFHGNSHYAAGTYSPGYYKDASYSTTYVADQVHYKRYVAVVPLVELPSYGSYYVPSPAGMPAPEAAKPPVADAAKKEILDAIRGVAAQVTTMSTRIDSLENRVKSLEGAKPAEPGGDKPPDPFKSTKSDTGLQMLHAKCASCHDSAAAKAKGGEFVMFITKDGTATLAKPSKSGLATDSLTPDDLKNAKRKITKGAMPPKKDHEGKAVPEVSEEERRAMVAFLEAAIKEGEKK